MYERWTVQSCNTLSYIIVFGAYFWLEIIWKIRNLELNLNVVREPEQQLISHSLNWWMIYSDFGRLLHHFMNSLRIESTFKIQFFLLPSIAILICFFFRHFFAHFLHFGPNEIIIIFSNFNKRFLWLHHRFLNIIFSYQRWVYIKTAWSFFVKLWNDEKEIGMLNRNTMQRIIDDWITDPQTCKYNTCKNIYNLCHLFGNWYVKVFQCGAASDEFRWTNVEKQNEMNVTQSNIKIIEEVRREIISSTLEKS